MLEQRDGLGVSLQSDHEPRQLELRRRSGGRCFLDSSRAEEALSVAVSPLRAMYAPASSLSSAAPLAAGSLPARRSSAPAAAAESRRSG